MKGQALMLFRRIFSSTSAAGRWTSSSIGRASNPEIYAEQRALFTSFEQELWKRFWELGNDEKLAKYSTACGLSTATRLICAWSLIEYTRSP